MHRYACLTSASNDASDDEQRRACVRQLCTGALSHLICSGLGCLCVCVWLWLHGHHRAMQCDTVGQYAAVLAATKGSLCEYFRWARGSTDAGGRKPVRCVGLRGRQPASQPPSHMIHTRYCRLRIMISKICIDLYLISTMNVPGWYVNVCECVRMWDGMGWKSLADTRR